MKLQESMTAYDYVIQTLQGSGYMEYSPVFYGFYDEKMYHVPGVSCNF